MAKKIINNALKAGFIFSAFYLLYGCYPKGPEYYSDFDLTATDYDPEYNFEDQKFFWLADTVEYITNIEDSEIDPDDVAAILQKVESKFDEKKYSRVPIDRPDEADFVITVSVIASKSSGIGWVPGPPWYPGWGWGPGWGGWYPPYWGGYYSYSYTTGSVIINWWDPDEAPVPARLSNDEDSQPVHWVATFNGLVSSSNQNNFARIDAGIDQAFKQSPYIESNK